MRTATWKLAGLLCLLPLAGCGFFQRIEQWKCDHFGCCYGGMTPAGAGCNQGTCGPAPCNQPPGYGPAPMMPQYGPNLIAPPPATYPGAPAFDPYQ